MVYYATSLTRLRAFGLTQTGFDPMLVDLSTLRLRAYSYTLVPITRAGKVSTRLLTGPSPLTLCRTTFTHVYSYRRNTPVPPEKGSL